MRPKDEVIVEEEESEEGGPLRKVDEDSVICEDGCCAECVGMGVGVGFGTSLAERLSLSVRFKLMLMLISLGFILDGVLIASDLEPEFLWYVIYG